MPLLKPPRGIQLNRSHPLARGLVGVWLMNEGGGNNVSELSGNNNTGTLYAHTAWAAGKFGSCLSFDGTDDYFKATLNGTTLTTLTISFWVRPTQTESSQKGIFQWATVLTSAVPFILVAREQNSTNIQFYVDDNYRLTTSIPNVAWSHISITLNSDNLWTFYLNGISAGTYQDDAIHLNQGNALYVYLGNGYAGYFNGSIDTFLIYKCALSASEIQQLYREPFAMFEQAAVEKLLYTAAGVIWLAGSAGVQSATSATLKQLRCIGGSALAQSQGSALCKIIRKVSGITASASDVTGLLKAILHVTASVGGIAAVDGMVTLRGEILLSGTVTGTAFLYGTLMSLAPQSWFSSSLEIERQWIREALFNGISANAFKLGTALTVGWFWVRVSGCSALYRGAGMEQIDFTNILAIAAQDARDIRPPSYLLHNSNSTYFYVVRRFNNCGYRECTLSAAVGLSIDAGGELAKPLPNNIFCSKTEQMDGNKIRLVWFYCPVGQKSKPEHFKIYWDGRTGQIDYDNPVATINYQGRKYYNYETVTLEPGRYLFAIRAEDAHGVENNSLSQLKIDMCTDTPDSISILSAETV